MSKIYEKLTSYESKQKYDLDKEYRVTQEVRDLFEKQVRKLTKEIWLRMLGGGIVIIYGAIGIRYNTGRYIQWALFTALVGVIVTTMVLLWGWITGAKLTILREIKQLRMEMNSILENHNESEESQP